MPENYKTAALLIKCAIFMGIKTVLSVVDGRVLLPHNLRCEKVR